MTTNSNPVVNSSVYYSDKSNKFSILLVECTKDNIDNVFSSVNMPETCKHYLFNAKAILKALALYDLGATLEIFRDSENEVHTEALELIDFNGEYLSRGELPPAMSIIALMTMFINDVNYNNIADRNKHKVETIYTFNKDDNEYKLLRYTNRSDDVNVDVTFMYALSAYKDGYYYIKSTYDLSSNSFKDADGSTSDLDLEFNIKEDYEKLFQ